MRCVDGAQSLPLAEGLALEAERENALFSGPDAQEGISAFVEKRRPDYG
jgi:enoyl-CoA hydratase